MSRPAYSAELMFGTITESGTLEGGPPVGFIYVVRDIAGTIAATNYFRSDLFFLVDATPFAQIVCAPNGEGDFHWQGRQVVPGPSLLIADFTGGAADAVASFRVMGYQLSI